jgi:hypothetical protein
MGHFVGFWARMADHVGGFIVWTWKWALTGLKTACLGGD